MRTDRSTTWWRWTLGLAILALVACEDGGGDETSGADGSGPGADVAAGDGGAGTCTPAGDAVELSGTWAQRIVHTAFVDLPVLGEQTKQTVAVFRAEVTQTGSDVAVRAAVCALEIDNGTDLVETLVPEAFLDSLPVQERTARLEEESGEWRYVRERYVEVRGAQLEEASTDPLPTSPADPAVFDQDGDGHPGVTLVSSGMVDGVMYVVQRSTDALESTCVGSDRIEGLSDWTDEQVILEADNDMLLSPRPTRPAPPEESTFVMVRVADDTDCAAILDRRGELFGVPGSEARMTDTRRSVYRVPKMDCPSEERVIRMALGPEEGVRHLDFDLGGRTLTVWHDGPPEPVTARLEPLGFGAQLVESEAADLPPEATVPGEGAAARGQSKTLWLVLAVNAVMFVGELAAGWLAESTGLIADSLDMLADALVYAISLYAVGRSRHAELRAARLSGVFQLVLALGAFGEVARRALQGSDPDPPWMMGTAAVALAANVATLLLLARHRHGGAHMKASWIFSTNDVLANLGVIVAGALVLWTGSAVPDLVIGTLIAALVLSGAVRILRLR